VRRVTVAAQEPDASAIAAVADALRAGMVVAYPTDTLYGLAVDPRQDGAVERLFALKGRSARIALPLVAADVDQARDAGELGPAELTLAAAFWPGPLSIVVPARSLVSRGVLGGGTTVAIRVPAHPAARALAAAAGFCITATSANVSGEPAAVWADEVARMLPGVDVVLDAGRAAGGPPSTIVAVTQAGPLLVRAGAVAWDRVIKSLQ
jgi:L-threonylcarbamoyladenylate synthase